MLYYHVFRKPRRLKSGKKVYKWYYYWKEPDGREIQKACIGCRNRSEAESYIRELAPPPAYSALPAVMPILIWKIAENMYIPGSAHVNRRRQLGKSTEMETMIECRRYIMHITELWGDLSIEELSVDLVMSHLFQDKHSGKWKNRFLEILGEIYSEAPWHGSKVARPPFQRFAANSKKADIFTTEELNRLFIPQNFPSELYYLFFLLCLSGGLRLGEARGVRVKQIIFDRKVLIVDGFCKADGTRTAYNKKGSPENPKFRVVYLPDLTLGKLADWIKENSLKPEDYCFSLENGQPICKETLERYFYKALQAAGFIPYPKPIERNKWGDGRKKQTRVKLKPPDGRKLVPHSLRYTFVSRMRRELSAVELLPMTGHASIENVDYYNRKALDLILAGLPKTGAAAVNTLFA